MKKLLLPVLLIICFAACRKDEGNDLALAKNTYANFSHLVPGNYWVYQQFRIDSVGQATATPNYDSAYVEKDTLINNRQYYKYVINVRGWHDEVSFLRDSLHYIVSSTGKVIFSAGDFYNIFERAYYMDPAHNFGPTDSIGYMERQMFDKDSLVTVPAGSFITSSMRTTWTMSPYHARNSRIRLLHARYSTSVGMVSETIPLSIDLTTCIDRRLVRYHIQ